MADVCPGCGARIAPSGGSSPFERYFACGAYEQDDVNEHDLGRFTPSVACLTRQLAQAQERHDKLYSAVCEVGTALGLIMPERAYLFEAEGLSRVKRLKEQIAAMTPIVRLAMAPEVFGWASKIRDEVSALDPEVRKAIGEAR